MRGKETFLTISIEMSYFTAHNSLGVNESCNQSGQNVVVCGQNVVVSRDESYLWHQAGQLLCIFVCVSAYLHTSCLSLFWHW